uniref:Small ribosomal subunit protein uS13m n=1 Tax=Ophioglossum californicum TaxID=1267209 RepID=A0A1B3TRF7_9MONI|nr:ribosomal protein S13 [Ophioglossum californicum]YP_010439841.1 ribosomal protein S13 [Ophioglossum vulgatum]AOH05894.1 ribosomal protein S13 [Ophioglossum californicum]UTD44887.1 ribosomal protein S13 [Ophioglossum vulgatum]
MSYILGTRSVSGKQVRIASVSISGTGPKRAVKVCDQLGISDSIKVHELTKHEIDKVLGIIRRKHFLVDSELKREIKPNTKRLISISCYRGFRHKAGLPLRGQRTHTNAKTCRVATFKRAERDERKPSLP